MQKTRAALICLALLFMMAPARAEVYVWKDPLYNIKLTYSDNWMRQPQSGDDMRLSILGPQGSDHAACRLYTSQDGRFMDAPASAGLDVSNLVFASDAIRLEMNKRADTRNAIVTSFEPTASLGKGAATLSYVDFQKAWAGGLYDMRAMVLGSQYNGKRILASCEALAGAWPIWEPTLKAIIKSIDFPAAYTVWPNSSYRPFHTEGYVYLPVNRRGTGYAAY